ncbi:uncharacterized protein LOC123392622 isoform X1 [Mustela putorius furo]|uniref:Uncharacterized protein LOC123392622 isoform X1 n=1 Tax=Mustela putorius furo TaxID=9669 RepID=A0A8U0S802_MUSPF|nr:uncharacterized protein LOC123392622 isoform X1 [Mustela putorius furo]
MPCTRPSRKHVRVRHFLLFSSLNPRCSAGSLGTGVWGVPASSVSDEDTWDSDVRSLVLSSSPCAVTQCCPLSLPPDLASSAQHLPGAGVHFGISHMAHGGRGRRELPLSTASPGAAFPAEEPPWCCSPASGSLPESTQLPQLPLARSGVATASRAACPPSAPAASAAAMVRAAAPSGQRGAAWLPAARPSTSTFKHIYTGSLARLANHRSAHAPPA